MLKNGQKQRFRQHEWGTDGMGDRQHEWGTDGVRGTAHPRRKYA